jgi:hypothetical protein
MTREIVRQTNLNISPGGVVSRRDLLRWIPAAGLAAGSLQWTDLLCAQTSKLGSSGKACILLWMKGGPSQFETFSPLTNHTNAGEFKAISTAVPGIEIAETLPHTAEVMDDICLIRSMTSKEGSHPRATYLLHTGYLPNPSVRYPSFGSNVAHQIGDAAAEIPSYVRIGRDRGYRASGGILGVDFNPFVMGDARKPPSNVSPNTDTLRFERRRNLLGSLDEQFRKRGSTGEALDHKKLYDRAAHMMLSDDMRAFNVEDEQPAIRDAYGDSPFAAGCLLARRLVEAGVTFVEVNLGNWDTHQDNFKRTRELCGQLDQPYAQLLRDLKQRGMLDNTLVICMGEFGRTPRINARAGRDHYPRAFSVALAGGGVRGGQVVGAVDNSGSQVTDQPVTVPDLFRTLCRALGVDPDHENFTSLDRPIKIADEGSVVEGVLG